MSKALRLMIRQPSAHYRNPKVFQNDYISTLDLPTKTTIIGMLTYLCGRRLKSDIDIGVVGTHKSKDIEFCRGEDVGYWDKYKSLKKGDNALEYLKSGKYVDYYKDNVIQNSILNYEVLKGVELRIYFTCNDEEEFNLVYNSLISPARYMNLGRKEDFIIPINKGNIVEKVSLKEISIGNTHDAIRKGVKIKNSYIKISLFESDKYENIIRQGSLMTLPSTYKDLEANKNNRVLVYDHYVYIGNEGIFPCNTNIQVYEEGDVREVFTWL